VRDPIDASASPAAAVTPQAPFARAHWRIKIGRYQVRSHCRHTQRLRRFLGLFAPAKFKRVNGRFRLSLEGL
jgi:hypothetical protein